MQRGMAIQRELARQNRLLAELHRELAPPGPIKKGTLSKRLMRCGQKNCRCQQDPSQLHGPYHIWTTKVQGRSRAVLVREEMVKHYREYIANYKKLKQGIKQLERVSDRILNAEKELLKLSD